MRMEKEVDTCGAAVAGWVGAVGLGAAAALLGGPVGLAALGGAIWGYTKKSGIIKRDLDDTFEEEAQRAAEYWRWYGRKPGETKFEYSGSRRSKYYMGMRAKRKYRFSLEDDEMKELDR